MKVLMSAMVLGLSLSSAAQADVQIFKMLDGSAVTCSANKEEQTKQPAGSKILSVSMEQDLSSDDQAEPVLKVAMVRCDEGQWVLDQSPASEKYTMNGVEVEVSYSNFEMLLVDDLYNILLQTNLEYLGGKSASETQTLKFAKNKNVAVQDLQLLLRAKRTVKAANGYEYSDSTSFGGFRVRLKNQ